MNRGRFELAYVSCILFLKKKYYFGGEYIAYSETYPRVLLEYAYSIRDRSLIARGEDGSPERTRRVRLIDSNKLDRTDASALRLL